jgi:crossover junction endodeoxyribonuclease RuvC
LLILGIDPGLNRTGYALLEYNGKTPQLREAGVLSTKVKEPTEQRLKTLYQGLTEIITEFQPSNMVVENLYSHYNHPQTAVIMGHARGIAFLAAASQNIPVACYAATRIKKSITGNGRASKVQVQRSIRSLMNLKDESARYDAFPDVADAIAVALCHIEGFR